MGKGAGKGAQNAAMMAFKCLQDLKALPKV